jgi:hypothetical protein
MAHGCIERAFAAWAQLPAFVPWLRLLPVNKNFTQSTSREESHGIHQKQFFYVIINLVFFSYVYFHYFLPLLLYSIDLLPPKQITKIILSKQQ